MPKDKEKDGEKKKKKEAKAAKEDKEEASEPKEEDEESEKEEEAPKRRKRKRKEPKGSSMMDKLWNLLTLGIAGALMYCRYNGIAVPYVDDFILYMKGQAGLGGGSGAPRHDAHSTLSDVQGGKAIVLEDFLMQLNRFCGSRARCTDEYWEALPDVAEGLKRGPGTWDRKPLQKAKAQEIDDILAKMSKQASARKLLAWKALRSISKELFDVTPKSMKPSLASKLAYDSKTPPVGGVEPEEETKKKEDDIVVDDL